MFISTNSALVDPHRNTPAQPPAVNAPAQPHANAAVSPSAIADFVNYRLDVTPAQKELQKLDCNRFKYYTPPDRLRLIHFILLGLDMLPFRN